jgi:hypothetical protein
LLHCSGPKKCRLSSLLLLAALRVIVYALTFSAICPWCARKRAP